MFDPKSKKMIKKNISKKDADKQRRVTTYNKSARRQEKLEKRQQQHELRRLARKKIADFKKVDRTKSKDPNEMWEDVDDHEKDVFDKDGYFEVMESEATISSKDQ